MIPMACGSSHEPLRGQLHSDEICRSHPLAMRRPSRESDGDFGIAISGIALVSQEASNIAGLASRDLERESSRERTNVHSRGARNDRQRVDSLHARWSTTGEPGTRSAAGPDSMCPT